MTEALQSSYLPLSYLYASRYSAGRLTVPVPKNQVLYANFRHIAGVPAPEGSPAFGVDKLHILDVLIGRLESIKTEPLAAAQAPEELTASRIDALIAQYGAEIHTLAAAPAMPYAPTGSIARPGMLFSLAA
jgi:hypothetical protein